MTFSSFHAATSTYNQGLDHEVTQRSRLSTVLSDNIPRAVSGCKSSTLPVIICAAGLRRKHAVHATSTGRISLLSGICESAESSQSGPPFATISAFSFSVYVHPMLMAFTLIPYCASSVALFWVRTLRAALEAEYA